MPHRDLSAPTPIYATDREVGEAMFGQDWRRWIALLPELEGLGLPPVRAELGGRRHLPSVMEFVAGLEKQGWHVDASFRRSAFPPDGPEYFR